VGGYDFSKPDGGLKPPLNRKPPRPAANAVRAGAKKPRTFTDGKGNLREVGTGRILKPAPKPKPAAGTAKPGTTAPKNPLDAAVDAAILESTAPLTNAINLASRQYDAEAGRLGHARDATNMELSGLAGRAQGLDADRLAMAARGMQGGQANYQQNMDFLTNLLGSSVQDLSQLQAAGNLTAGQLAADGAAGATQAQLNAGALQNDLARMQAATTMRSREDLGARLTARDASITGYNQRIADARAQAPFIRRKFEQEDLQNKLLKQEAELAKQQAQHAMNMDRMQFWENRRQFNEGQANAFDLAAMEGGGEGSGPGGKNASMFGFRINKKYDEAIGQLYSTIQQEKVNAVGPDGKPTNQMVDNPARRWNQVTKKLQDIGVGKAQAYLLASKWMPERVGQSTPWDLYKRLKGEGLVDGTIKLILNTYYHRAPHKPGFFGAQRAWDLRNGPPRVNASRPPARPGGGPTGHNPGGNNGSDRPTSTRPPKPSSNAIWDPNANFGAGGWYTPTR
jgi:hypothetical protein